MAAGYQTASPVFVDDKMMQMPWELMSQVITKKDAEIDLSVGEAGALRDMLKIQALNPDKDRANELAAEYDDEVYNITQSILKNPLEHQKELHRIRNLSRKLGKDMEQGEWAAIQGNYDTHMSESKRINELKNSDGYEDNYKSALVQDKLKKYQGVGYNADGSYNQYGNIDATSLGNMNEWVDKRLKDAIPDAQSVEQDTKNGGWIIRTKTGTKSMSEEELAVILKDSFDGDTGLKSAIAQRAKLGLDGFQGILDKDDNIRPMVGMQSVKMTDGDGKEIEVPQLSFGENMVGNAFRAGVTKFGFMESTYSQTQKADAYDLANYKSKLTEQRSLNKEKRQEQYVNVSRQQSLTTYVPQNKAELEKAVVNSAETITALKTQATEMLKNKFGKDLTPEEALAIDAGNFDILYASGILPESIDPIVHQYKNEVIRQGTYKAAESTWRADMAKEYNTNNAFGVEANPEGFKQYLKANEGRFNLFLNKSTNVTMDVNNTWEGTGVTEAQRKTGTKQIVEGGYYKDFSFPYNGKETTVRDLIQRGDIVVEQEKIGQTGYVNNPNLSAEANAKLAAIPNQKVSYRFVDGSGYLNLDVSPDSILPATALDDDNQLNLGMNISINGKDVFAEISTDKLSTSGIDAFKSANAENLAFTQHLARISSVNNYSLPHMPGVIINGKDKTVIPGPGQPSVPLHSAAGMYVARQVLGY